MIYIKDENSIQKMLQAGKLLSEIFLELPSRILPGVSTLEINNWIESQLLEKNLKTTMKGYHGYKHVSCISLNEEVVHGVPRSDRLIKENDVVKVDVCASWQGYCADMARPFVVGAITQEVQDMITAAKKALNAGIQAIIPGNKVSDISYEIQKVIDVHGYGIVREFAGHGIGASMHEDPDVCNYGKPGRGAILREGMAFAIEPMITRGSHEILIEKDGWTARTKDRKLAMHIEDTVIVQKDGPLVTTATGY
jgi:methionyl aminopeptidase